MNKDEILNKLKKGLIVSCQALENEPLYGSDIMAKMALAAKEGGAVAIRANSISDIKAIKDVVDLPIIGLIKIDYENSKRYITPTMKEIDALIEAKVDIIAMDATNRSQIDNVSLEDKVKYIKKHNILTMADISNLEEGIDAEKYGFDLISTTLSGYTEYSKQQEGPDFELVEDLINNITTPVIAEGRISDVIDLARMAEVSPFAIVMGGAITRPQQITKNYINVMKNKNFSFK
ncbi:N-acetylmannosamine-6-phosphate 2-epimerase [Haploplasma modicum]|uniref:N-acetylmannosamine-6-phosphate 2-epimerase n=1 Tax=Haploplasma modicum TaxID=2150 RepID=UPI000AC61465|nr:N-acetylmannosamine-6-phosphate 2-epimerase [Haploplasma modicum]